MKKIILIFGLIFSSALLSAAKKTDTDYTGSVQELDTVVAYQTTYEINWPDYDPWTVVTLDGKLKMKGLPVTPSVKIFMRRNSLITMSLRAPFVGEVGRLDLTPDSLTIVNKMNKTYVKERIPANSMKLGGLGINDIQDLLLGRFFLPGHDVVNEDLEELVDVFYEDNQFNVIPKAPVEIPGIKYGFAVDEEFNPILLVVMPEENTSRDIEVSAEYTRKSSGYDLLFAYSEGSRTNELAFEFKAPDWKGDAPKEVELGNKYRQVSFMEFLTKLGK